MKISQIDSNYDFYGCSKTVIYTPVAVGKDGVIHLVQQKVTLSHMELAPYLLTYAL